MGRKSKWESHIEPRLEEIAELYQEHDEAEIAAILGIGTTTWEKYKAERPELREALRKGKDILVRDLKESLKKKAKGYEYVETKEYIRKNGDGSESKVVERYKKYAHPDLGAIHLLLKNLDPTWHNDDEATLQMKREHLEIEKKKAENGDWF